MRRLLVFNNYPLEALWDAVKRGEAPDQLLFGINFFAEAGWQVTFVPFDPTSFWHRVNLILRRGRFPIPIGDLQQQRDAWKYLNRCDLIYAACQTQAHVFSYLRALGLIRRPLVCLAHHPLNRGKLARLRNAFLRWQLCGTDAFPSLSRSVTEQINALAPGKSSTLPWGPDAGFYRPSKGPGRGVLAVGRTGRDFATFGLGATAANAPVRIICLESNIVAEFSRFGTNVIVDVQPNAGWMSYPQLVEHYDAARAVAIPLHRQESIAGLSTLADALGMGKPIIMTRHPLVDLDIEREGVGRWVEPGDVAGWCDAVNWFETHPEEALGMGRRARNLVEMGLNSQTFAKRMLTIFDDALRGE
jgi:glycosyltransferase involved in cell wall biosynthesis